MKLWLQREVALVSLRWCLLALLGGVARVLAVRCDGSSSSSHSLRNFRTVVSEPGPGLPLFIAVSYVDDQPIVHYDSHTRRTVPVAPWMWTVEQDFEEASQVLRGTEWQLRKILETLMAHFHHNSSTGPHTLQLMFSCELWPDGQPKGGLWKYAYDGEDLLKLDTEAPTWMDFVPPVETLKQKLAPLLGDPHRSKGYLDESCVYWLRKYLGYGNETLQRTESPTVKVARKKGDNSLETLFCQVYGFYPKEINVTWLKDGKPDNLTGCVLPNSDGTYYISLSIKVEPEERDRYRCRVEHSSLLGPLDLAWKEPGSSSSSHSLRNFRTVVSEPGPGLPLFIAVGYVDDQPIVHYDSHTQRMVPVAPWMRKVDFEEASQVLRGTEWQLRKILETLMAHFHHDSSTGPHTLQLMFSCELWPDGRPKGGVWKYAYDGEDLLALDRETPTWMFILLPAETLKQKLDPLLDDPRGCKDYLNRLCVDWLQKYLGYGNETLQRTESPTVKVARKKGDNSLETLFCQVYGFYPKEINVTWLKDGKPDLFIECELNDGKPDNLTGCVLPNSDGTYYISLSIKVEPEETYRYRCRVEHSSLLGPLDLAWKEPGSNLGLALVISGSTVVVVILVVAGVIFYIYKRRPKGGNTSTPRKSDQKSDSCRNGLHQNPLPTSPRGDTDSLSPLPSGESDEKSDSCCNGDRGQVSVFFQNGDSAQVFYCSGNGKTPISKTEGALC